MYEKLKSNFVGFATYLLRHLTSFGRTSNPNQTEAVLRRGFMCLLSQVAILTGSDGGSDGVEPTLSVVTQNRQTSCSM